MTKARMSNSEKRRCKFLEAWMRGLKIYSNFNKTTSISQRKQAIKLSADVAIASTAQNSLARWSQAQIDDVASRDNGTNRIMIERIVGHKFAEQKRPSTRSIKCSKKILRGHISTARSAARKSVVPNCVQSSSIVARRMRVLKKLLPGGKELNDISLIQEALDYVVWLQVQRDVMNHVARAAERSGLFQFLH